MYVDAHCHVMCHPADSTASPSERAQDVIASSRVREQLSKAREANASVLPLWMATDLEESQFGSIGVHPWYSYRYYLGSEDDKLCSLEHYKSVLNQWDDSWIDLLPTPINLNKFSQLDWTQVKCCGEIGLDKKFIIPNLPQRVTVTLSHQLEIFHWFLHKSVQYSLPVSIHCVGYAQYCYEACIEILNVPHCNNKIMLHSYSGSQEQLLQQWIPKFQDRLFITISELNQKKIGKMFNRLPIDHLLTETDLSWNNVPTGLDITLLLQKLYELIANSYQLPMTQVEETIWNNFHRFLHRSTH